MKTFQKSPPSLTLAGVLCLAMVGAAAAQAAKGQSHPFVAGPVGKLSADK